MASSLAPSSASTTKRSSRSNHPRQSSGVYNTFTTKQIQGFKEAFHFLDQPTGDSLLSRSDLASTLANLGQPNDREAVDRLFAEVDDPQVASGGGGGGGGGGVNFTQFLTMFGERLSGMDDAETLLEAFECFDEKDEGWIEVAELRKWLGEVGDRMDEREIDRLVQGPFTDRSGRKFDYKAFVEAVKMSEPAELE
ncbi:EF-hand [Jaminaea rosea]|uniref:EF-hand n=1 Tax=Jaminaea rosea TaxID=1569628 RepID=A0A316UTV7_9BASI|nr:EF-hand [Jaminaea rosea]PWN28702.1 EF-hand [Jaminaea rosea]